MRKITKKLFAMALTMCFAMSVSAAGYIPVFGLNFDDGSTGASWGSSNMSVNEEGQLVLTNETADVQHSQQACFPCPDPFEIAGKYALTMKIRGDEPGSIHALLQYTDEASGYPHIEFPLINFTTEWQTIKVKVTNTFDKAQDFFFR